MGCFLSTHKRSFVRAGYGRKVFSCDAAALDDGLQTCEKPTSSLPEGNGCGVQEKAEGSIPDDDRIREIAKCKPVKSRFVELLEHKGY